MVLKSFDLVASVLSISVGYSFLEIILWMLDSSNFETLCFQWTGDCTLFTTFLWHFIFESSYENCLTWEAILISFSVYWIYSSLAEFYTIECASCNRRPLHSESDRLSSLLENTSLRKLSLSSSPSWLRPALLQSDLTFNFRDSHLR